MSIPIIVTPEEEKHIKSKYERNEDELKNDIAYIKEWLKKQAHLPQDEDDFRIEQMIVLNKFSLEKTKSKLDFYYSLKHFVPELFENREPLHPAMLDFMDKHAYFPLPRLTPQYHRVFISHYISNEECTFDMDIYYKLVFAVLDIMLMHDIARGDQFILNFEKLTWIQIRQMTPASIKKIITFLIKAYSDIISGIHLLNLPSVATFLVSVLTSALPEKLTKRVFVHKNLESLHEVIPKDILPLEYGGTAGSIKDLYEPWKMFLRSKNDWIKATGMKRSDETKRIGEQLNTDWLGTPGSFRKLDID